MDYKVTEFTLEFPDVTHVYYEKNGRYYCTRKVPPYTGFTVRISKDDFIIALREYNRLLVKRINERRPS